MSGHGPPDSISPSALVAYLKEKPRPSKVVKFPSETLRGTLWENVRIIVPPSAANGEAQLAAHKRMRDELKIPLAEWQTETGVAMLGDFTAKEMIARTVFSEKEIATDKYAKLFAGSGDVERCLSADEVAVLFALMQQVQFELGPRLRVLTDAEVDAWIERLKLGFEDLAYLSGPDLDVLIRGFHRRLTATENAQSDTSPSLDFQDSRSPSISESTLESSAMGTICCGEPPDAPVDGLMPSDESITPEDAAEIARKMSGK